MRWMIMGVVGLALWVPLYMQMQGREPPVLRDTSPVNGLRDFTCVGRVKSWTAKYESMSRVPNSTSKMRLD